MAGPEGNKPQQSEFLKDMQDRVAADPEMVGQVMNPDRTPETVRFRDPSATGTGSAPPSGTPQSVAEFEMARRTDAGRRATGSAALAGANRPMLAWLGGAVLLIALVLALAWMWAS